MGKLFIGRSLKGLDRAIGVPEALKQQLGLTTPDASEL